MKTLRSLLLVVTVISGLVACQKEEGPKVVEHSSPETKMEIISPEDGDVLSETSIIEVSFGDTIGVVKIDVLANEVKVAEESMKDYIFSIEFDTKDLEDGPYHMEFLALDKEDQEVDKVELDVIINNSSEKSGQ